MKKHIISYSVIIVILILMSLLAWANVLEAETATIKYEDREELVLVMKEEIKTLSEENLKLNSDLERAFDKIEMTAAVSPLIGLVSEDEIFTIIDEIPKGYIFRGGFALTAGFGVSIGAHGKPRTNHQGADILPADKEDLSTWGVTPIAGGVVGSFGMDSVYGKYVIVRHSDRVRSFYGHLEKIYYSATTGKKVTSDTDLGIMGNTGLVYSDYKKGGGKHVHFEIQVWTGERWVAVDPLPFLDIDS